MDIFLKIVSNVFLFIAAGWLLQKTIPSRFNNIERYFINFVYYAIVPFFIFISIVQTSVPFSYIWKVGAASWFVLFGGGVLSFLIALLLKTEFRNTVLPISIMNTAYLAIPVNTLLWGSEGSFWAVIYNISVSIIHFTVGVLIVKKEKNFFGFWDLPAVYGLIAGFIFKIGMSNTAAETFLKNSYSNVSSVILPVMLIFMGMKITTLKLNRFSAVGVGIAARIIGGFILGYLAVKLMGLEKTAAAVCIISSSMPTAINTYILGKKFNADPEFASGMVLGGVAVSLITIPAVYYFIVSVIR